MEWYAFYYQRVTNWQQPIAKFDEANRQQLSDELGGAKWQQTKTITTMTHCPHKKGGWENCVKFFQKKSFFNENRDFARMDL